MKAKKVVKEVTYLELDKDEAAWLKKYDAKFSFWFK